LVTISNAMQNRSGGKREVRRGCQSKLRASSGKTRDTNHKNDKDAEANPSKDWMHLRIGVIMATWASNTPN
jgi:hypothetical protein